MNLLEQIANHLDFLGFGQMATAESPGDIVWGRMADQPDDIICVFSTDTAVPGSEQGARVQIMNRAKSPRKAYETSAAIAYELDGFDGFLGGDGVNARIEIINAAQGLGGDEKKREIYVTNIRVFYCDE